LQFLGIVGCWIKISPCLELLTVRNNEKRSHSVMSVILVRQSVQARPLTRLDLKLLN
jgi:hypothetical protein